MIAFSATGRTRRIAPNNTSSTLFTIDGGAGQNTVIRIVSRCNQAIHIVFGGPSIVAPADTADNVEFYVLGPWETTHIRTGPVTHAAVRSTASSSGSVYFTPGIIV